MGTLPRVVKTFLNAHWDGRTPLFLGYSGGPDSKALLYALLECGVKPHLAHADHGWRPESAAEADLLRREAEQLGCPFSSARLDAPHSEDAARKARFSFFSSLSPSFLLLAHQADDLAETVLKRVLEGAHLAHLGGMRPVSTQGGMTIWRPLLTVRRSLILEFLEERSLVPLMDASNLNPAYLRARMRLEIFPWLNQHFGKETTENLTLLSERAFELKEYLDRKVAHVPIHRGPEGTSVDLRGLDPLEQRHLLQKIAREEGITLSRSLLDQLLAASSSKILIDKGQVKVISLASTGSKSPS